MRMVRALANDMEQSQSRISIRRIEDGDNGLNRRGRMWNLGKATLRVSATLLMTPSNLSTALFRDKHAIIQCIHNRNNTSAGLL